MLESNTERRDAYSYRLWPELLQAYLTATLADIISPGGFICGHLNIGHGKCLLVVISL